MRINEFPVSLAVDPGSRSQLLICLVRLSPEADPEVCEAIRTIFKSFADAGRLGMFGGAGFVPAMAALEIIETRQTEQLLEFQVALENVPASSCRVLIGMLRGQVLIDGFVEFIEITGPSSATARPLLTLRDERAMELPYLAPTLSFTYVHEESMRLTDRAIRVTARQSLGEDAVRHLERVQSTWEAVCEGGGCDGATHAVECGVLCERGIVIAPQVYEIKIPVFNASDMCFDFFVNAVERMSKTILPVEAVEVW